MHLKTRAFGPSLLLIWLSALLLIAYAAVYYFPGNMVSITAFKAGYYLTFDKKAYLESYSPRRKDVDAGEIPPPVDKFLCEHAETTEDDEEIAAIVDFYTIQAGGREGACVYAGSDETRQKIAARIVETMSDGALFRDKMILLKEIMLGRTLGKGLIGIENQNDDPASLPQYDKFTDNEIPVARAKYREWWNSGLNWEEKQKTDPLAGTRIKVLYCCG